MEAISGNFIPSNFSPHTRNYSLPQELTSQIDGYKKSIFDEFESSYQYLLVNEAIAYKHLHPGSPEDFGRSLRGFIFENLNSLELQRELESRENLCVIEPEVLNAAFSHIYSDFPVIQTSMLQFGIKGVHIPDSIILRRTRNPYRNIMQVVALVESKLSPDKKNRGQKKFLRRVSKGISGDRAFHEGGLLYGLQQVDARFEEVDQIIQGRNVPTILIVPKDFDGVANYGTVKKSSFTTKDIIDYSQKLQDSHDATLPQKTRLLQVIV